MYNKKARGCPDFYLKIPGEPFSVRRTVHLLQPVYVKLAACDGVLNSSTCCHTTHTHTGHTYAEHYNGNHRLLIGVIISAMADLSMFWGCSIQLREAGMCPITTGSRRSPIPRTMRSAAGWRTIIP